MWVALPAAIVAAVPAVARRPTTERVSVDSVGRQANGDSTFPAISANGRYVAFHSFAPNLVARDTNGAFDVFVRDRRTGLTERVSVDSAGAQANSSSDSAEISASGRHVAFHSFASNLVTGDTNDRDDAFVHDRRTGLTERVSVDSAGVQANEASFLPAINANGRYVGFVSRASNLVAGDTNDALDVFVHDRRTGLTERVSVGSAGAQANGHSNNPVLSATGRYVAFASQASNLVPGDTNNASDVFVHDRRTGLTERVSVDSAGGQVNGDSGNPAISAKGRYVGYASFASNLVPGDTNNTSDVFVHDRRTGVTERVSVDSAGRQANGDPGSERPAFSSNGGLVAFDSFASNLVAGDTNNTFDVFVHDRRTGATERVSVGNAGGQGNGESSSPTISANGRQVAFLSLASNLVPGDTNGAIDAFVRER